MKNCSMPQRRTSGVGDAAKRTMPTDNFSPQMVAAGAVSMGAKSGRGVIRPLQTPRVALSSMRAVS